MQGAGYNNNAGYNPRPVGFGTKVPNATPSEDLNIPDSNREKGQGSGVHLGTVDRTPYKDVPNPISNLPKEGNVAPNAPLR